MRLREVFTEGGNLERGKVSERNRRVQEAGLYLYLENSKRTERFIKIRKANK
jgi:hypothetical protein